jgi:hypothetical protein
MSCTQFLFENVISLIMYEYSFSSYARSCAYLRTIKGILPSLSSFIAILNGSDSLPTLMSTGAFMLTCAGQAHVTGAEGRIDRIHCGGGREWQEDRSRRKRGREMAASWWLYLQCARSKHSRSLKLCHIRRRDALLSLAAGVLHVCHPVCFSASHPPPVVHTSARTQMLDAHAPASSSTAESTCGRTPFGSSAISSSSLLHTSARSKTTQTQSSRRARGRGGCVSAQRQRLQGSHRPRARSSRAKRQSRSCLSSLMLALPHVQGRTGLSSGRTGLSFLSSLRTLVYQ